MKHQKDIMLRFVSYDIVFQEIPDEVSLAINISGCPHRCAGCHSPHLRQDIGEELTEEIIASILKKYKQSITCVCFMGGDNNPKKVNKLADFIRKQGLKTAWYSGFFNIQNVDIKVFDYVKIGPYIEKYGGLNSKNTNQRFYKINKGQMIDLTNRFAKEEEVQFVL